MKVLLKSARIIDEKSDFHHTTRDILIEDGQISKIESTVKADADEVLEYDNLHVSRGWFDSSVAFGEPGLEERETLNNGLKTAGKSGFTDILLNPVASPVIDSQANVEFLLARNQNSTAQLHPIACLTKAGKGEELAELFEMQGSGAKAFGDFKREIPDANLMKIGLQYTQNFSGLICAFPQSNTIAQSGMVHEHQKSLELGMPGIPSLAESLQISRDLHLLEYTGGKLHIPTISTRAGLELIAAAKERGLDVTCSVAVHNLWFTDAVLENFDAQFKVSPPLRLEEDRQALLEGLKDGTIDMVTSDHTPVDIEQKKREFEHAAYGTIGLESAFGTLNSLMGFEKTIDILTRGRRRFSLSEPKIAVGEKAALSLFNPDQNYKFTRKNINSTSKNSIFLNRELKGRVLGSIRANKLILND